MLEAKQQVTAPGVFFVMLAAWAHGRGGSRLWALGPGCCLHSSVLWLSDLALPVTWPALSKQGSHQNHPLFHFPLLFKAMIGCQEWLSLNCTMTFSPSKQLEGSIQALPPLAPSTQYRPISQLIDWLTNQQFTP